MNIRQTMWMAFYSAAISGICSTEAFTHNEWDADGVAKQARAVADAAMENLPDAIKESL